MAVVSGSAAAIGAGLLGAGGSFIQAREQADAISDAQHAQTQANQQALNLFREIYNDQSDRLEPFRQFDLQRLDAMGEILGFSPVGQSAQQAPTPAQNYLAQQPDVARAAQNLSPRNQSFIAGRGFDANSDGQISPQEFANYHYETHGRNEGRTGFGNVQTVTAASQQPRNALAGSPAPSNVPGLFDSSIAGADRFNNSLFNPMAQNMFSDATNRLEANLSGQGLNFSGAHMQAQQNAAANISQQALGNYLNFLMGAPSTSSAANSQNAAAGAFGQQTGNALYNQGAIGAQSAYANAQNTNALLGNLTNLGGFALGAFG